MSYILGEAYDWKDNVKFRKISLYDLLLPFIKKEENICVLAVLQR